MKKDKTSNNIQENNSQEENAIQIPKDKGEEVGGPKGLEPTRFGDWERNGRCSDF